MELVPITLLPAPSLPVTRFTLKQLSYFVAAGEAGGVKQAARALHVAQSSVSEAVAQLEQTFRLQLFVRRHARGVSLTPDGTRLMAAARRLLAEARAFGEQAASLGPSLTGTLQVGCFKTIAPIILPALMRRSADLYPLVTLELTVADQADLLDDLRRGRLDLALVYDVDRGPEVTFHPLTGLPPTIMLGPALAARLPGPDIDLAEMAPHDLIFLDLPITRGYHLNLFHRLGLHPRIAHRTTALSMVKALVANDFGYGLVNERARNDHAVDGRPLAIRTLRDDVPPITLGVAEATGRTTSRKAAAFIAICAASFGSEHSRQKPG